MTSQTAQSIVLGISAVAGLVWLAGLFLWWKTKAPKQPEPFERRLPGKGMVDVRDSLSRAAALMVPPWELEGGDEAGAVFTISIAGRPEVLVEVRQDTDGETMATAQLTPRQSPGWYRWLMSVWLLVLIPAVTVVGATLLLTYVVPHPSSNVRGQTLQMAQVAHFLWPPFLFWGIRQGLFKLARQQCQRFLTTLELL